MIISMLAISITFYFYSFCHTNKGGDRKHFLLSKTSTIEDIKNYAFLEVILDDMLLCSQIRKKSAIQGSQTNCLKG